MTPGARLKDIRERLGVSVREVADFSKVIAEAEGSDEFLISGPYLTQIESDKKVLPSMFKLFTLASIYGRHYSELLALYGVNSERVNKYQAELPFPRTRLAKFDLAEEPARREIPARFDAGLDHTKMFSQVVKDWGRVPLQLTQRLDYRNRLYGFIGLQDFTLYPLIRPGTFVEIDPQVKRPRHGLPRSEFDRPIYFVDLRSEYACSWCEVTGDKLFLLAHPLSPVKTRSFVFEKEADIVGQVTGVAMRIALSGSEPGKLI